MNTSRVTTSKGISSLFFNADPGSVAQQSKKNPFDVIVIGSGMGGGILAHSLADRNQRVLLLERGDLLFTTHALNTTRPHADLSKKIGPTQDNDIVYSLLKENVMLTEESDPWAGGALYCVGGRSNAWGLYIPRIDQKTLKEYFPPAVVTDLADSEDPERGNYYKRAEFLMLNKDYAHEKNVHTEPLDNRERTSKTINQLLQDKHLAVDKHKELVDALTATINKREDSDESIDVKPIADMLGKALKDYSSHHFDGVNLADLHWALLGAQFNSKDRYEFPQGAFSSTDRLLEAVFRSHKNTSTKMLPPYLTVLHNTLVTELVLDNDVVRKVKTVTASGLQHTFRGKRIVLCAGTIDSPALLLRSSIEVQCCQLDRGETDVGAMHVPKYNGVTDHNIYGFRFTIKGGGQISAAKLQLEGEVSMCAPTQAGGAGEDKRKIPFLLNICINASSFLSRGFEEYGESPDNVCTLTYEFRAPINHSNFVALDVSTGQPILHIKNSGEETVSSGRMHPNIERSLSELNIFIEETLRQATQKGDQKSQLRNEQVWKAAGLGCVAHEIGTLPLSDDPKRGAVDANLKFHKFQNLYACDMSVFPVSPPANPSLTLVALAVRLADHITEKGAEERCLVEL